MIETDYGVKYKLYNIAKTKNFYYYFRYNKKSYQGTTGTPEEHLARICTNNLIHDLYNNIVKEEPKKSKRRNLTFQQMYDFFMEEKSSLTDRARKNYEGMSKFILEYFGEWSETDFKKIKDSSLYGRYQAFRKDYYKNKTRDKNGEYIINGKNLFGREVGGVTLNKECGLIHNVLTFNKYHQAIFADYNIPKYSRNNDIKFAEKPRLQIPTKEEYEIIKEYYDCDSKGLEGQIYLLYVRFLVNTGCRVGESLKVSVHDIHTVKSKRFLYFRNRKSNRGNIINTPFPLVGKLVGIVDDVLSLTKEVREESIRCAEQMPKGDVRSKALAEAHLLFLNPVTKKGIGYIKKSFKSAVNYACKEMKYDEGDDNYTRLKSLTLGFSRHFFLSNMVKEKVISIYTLAKLAGHTNIDTIQRNYVSVEGDDMYIAMADAYAAMDKEEVRRKEGKNPFMEC